MFEIKTDYLLAGISKLKPSLKKREFAKRASSILNCLVEISFWKGFQFNPLENREPLGMFRDKMKQCLRRNLANVH